MNMNDAGGGKGGNVMIASKRAMPGDEAVGKISHGIAVWVFHDWHLGFGGFTLPDSGIMGREAR